MLKIIFGVFILLHGLVHMLYFGQSARYFEMQPGMTWPDGSWLFSGFMGETASRNLVNVLLILVTIAFLSGGIGILLNQNWWQPVVVAAAIFSSLLYFVFWDGGMQHLDNKGGIGILINLVILVTLLVFHWPNSAAGNK